MPGFMDVYNIPFLLSVVDDRAQVFFVAEDVPNGRTAPPDSSRRFDSGAVQQLTKCPVLTIHRDGHILVVNV